MAGQRSGYDEPKTTADLIVLADRWRVAGAALRKKNPGRFLRHLDAIEQDCASGEIRALRRPI